MRDPALSIRDMMVASSFNWVAGGVAPFGVYLGQPPATPDAIILLNRTGGIDPVPQWLVNYPSLQVMVRGKKSGYEGASATIDQICNFLLGIKTYVDPTSGDQYQACNQLGDVFYAGQDDNTRPHFTANFRFIVLPAVVAGGNRLPIT